MNDSQHNVLASNWARLAMTKLRDRCAINDALSAARDPFARKVISLCRLLLFFRCSPATRAHLNLVSPPARTTITWATKEITPRQGRPDAPPTTHVVYARCLAESLESNPTEETSECDVDGRLPGKHLRVTRKKYELGGNSIPAESPSNISTKFCMCGPWFEAPGK